MPDPGPDLVLGVDGLLDLPLTEGFPFRSGVEQPLQDFERDGGAGLAGAIHRFWVVPTPEIGFRSLAIHKSETNLRNQFFSNNLLWDW
jgi:hypothetical protein